MANGMNQGLTKERVEELFKLFKSREEMSKKSKENAQEYSPDDDWQKGYYDGKMEIYREVIREIQWAIGESN